MQTPLLALASPGILLVLAPASRGGGTLQGRGDRLELGESCRQVFDDLASEQTGTRHSFTTKPIASGVQTRVLVKVNGPKGASSISIGVRSGEKATVDMRN